MIFFNDIKNVLFFGENDFNCVPPYNDVVALSSNSRTMDPRRLNPKFFAAQIQIPIPANKYLGSEYKGLVFCRNDEKHGQGTDCTKMGADSSAKDTPNDSEFICPIGLPNLKNSEFQ